MCNIRKKKRKKECISSRLECLLDAGVDEAVGQDKERKGERKENRRTTTINTRIHIDQLHPCAYNSSLFRRFFFFFLKPTVRQS